MDTLPRQTDHPLDIDEVLVILSSLARTAAVTQRKLDADVLRTIIGRLIR